MISRKTRILGALGTSALLVAVTACASGTSTTVNDGGTPIVVGVPTSLTGPLGTYGKMIQEGLKAGLFCSTNGTNIVDGHPVSFDVQDDGGDATKALTSATGMVGRGENIIVGTSSSGISLQIGKFAEEQNVLFISGAAGTDEMTGLNENAFRSSRQAYQETAALASVLPNATGNVVILAQDYAFGQTYVKTATKILDKATVTPVLVPLNANEFTAYARRVVEAKPDLLIVVYYGDTSAAMWQALVQQKVLTSTKVATLLVEKKNWPVYGEAAKDITFVSHYFPGASDSELNKCLTEQAPGADLSTHDGFVTAQMVVHAIKTAGPDDVSGMIRALEGWSFEAPKGKMAIRASDHAMGQDLFLASLDNASGTQSASVKDTIPGDKIAPPENEIRK
ncbi:branched-chain amino acid transport system substrate-binding protein [Arthrobacter sp. V1I7]|uniref:substrate-binding domain-containing protein n=1 Tax=Arthrobacter sp. V1I7 TaxID=3042274 RepID=UPI00277D66C2|nr:substrate-binding domain-containing protein [Arthrobacter sp. V1I7]MDQ0823763.1 branched-chain amino acid transport system substrate-binding protein [Arthrobacter sp. V1I7]